MMKSRLPIALFTASLILGTAAAQTLPVDDVRRIQQRQAYAAAVEALASDDMAGFRQLQEQLSDYPLLPYLEYAELTRELGALPSERIDDFLTRHGGTVLAARLERQWLTELVAANRTADMIRYYHPANASTDLTCRVIKARLDDGDNTALDAVAPLWNVDYSQPNVCDPVFDAWLAAGGLDAQTGWERFSKNIRAGNANLASYIAGLLPEPEQSLARTWLALRSDPGRLNRMEEFSAADSRTMEMVIYGLQRLAQSDALRAHELLLAYASRLAFGDQERLGTERAIIQRMLSQGHIARAETLLRDNPDLRSASLAEWLLRRALASQDWAQLQSWLDLLPDSDRQSERWQYWEARSLMQQGTPESLAAASNILQAAAVNRSYYDFLAAERLNQPYDFVDRPVMVSDAELGELARLPAMDRALELYQVGDEANALLEWNQAVASLDEQQVKAAGRLAANQGWHRNGIQAMIRVSYWDDLQLRFPLVYQDHVASAVDQHPELDPFLVNAVARQESAFMTDAISSAGAMGLMQLMPATARETARGAGMPISEQDLLKPDVNIALGSRYLARLLQDFGGNRMVAAAAYNAGPNRVRQWLGRNNTSLPFDVWIETIPFAETRLYVQNVLAYAVIYAYRNGQHLPILSAAEMESLL